MRFVFYKTPILKSRQKVNCAEKYILFELEFRNSVKKNTHNVMFVISYSPAAITIFVLAFIHYEYFSLSNQPCCPPRCSASYPASAMTSSTYSCLHSLILIHAWQVFGLLQQLQ